MVGGLLGQFGQYRMPIRRRGGLAEEALTHSIIGAFFEVYGEMGFGLLESSHVTAMEKELVRRGIRVAREVAVRVYYKGEAIAWHRLDMVVDDKVIVECKSTMLLHPAAARQITNYLKTTRFEVGLLLHFGLDAKFYRFFEPNTAKPAIRSESSGSSE
jgi:GxxExxY protein